MGEGSGGGEHRTSLLVLSASLVHRVGVATCPTCSLHQPAMYGQARHRVDGSLREVSTPPSAKSRPKEHNVWDSIITLAHSEIINVIVKGGLIMIPLLAASLLAVTVIVERLYFWRRLRVHEIDSAILARVAEGDFKQAMEIASASRHPVARVLHAGLR